ncbi:hypothetical protein [uncultured Williamsia sp.]|uniref:hypothetical protein n=1 Tax=uncultured Williamsia sp. TaxID=259311 RepID=UPI0026340453|nr:hypothetical protein [uncultured Williamsia sp.]
MAVLGLVLSAITLVFAIALLIRVNRQTPTRRERELADTALVARVKHATQRRDVLADADELLTGEPGAAHTHATGSAAAAVADAFTNTWNDELIIPRRLRTLTGLANALEERGGTRLETEMVILGDWQYPAQANPDDDRASEQRRHEVIAALAAELAISPDTVEDVYQLARRRQRQPRLTHSRTDRNSQ